MTWVLLPLSGFGGNAPQQAGAAPDNVYMLSFASPDAKRVLPALNIEILTDYNNGYYLARGAVYDSSYLKGFGIAVRELPENTMLKFPVAGYNFDTRLAEPAIPATLTASGSDEMIVQFIGPIKAEWTKAVQSAGIVLEDYFDSNAFMARMSDEQAAAVKALPFVRWVGQYQPAYKVQSELMEMSGLVPISVIAHSGVSQEQLAAILDGYGAVVTATWADPVTAEGIIFQPGLASLARDSNVASIFWNPNKELLDFQAGKIHHFHEAWMPPRSGLPTNLTGHSPGPDGIMGNADDVFEVIGIQDSGFDANNANAGWIDVFMGPIGDRIVALRRRTAQCSQPDGRVNGVAHGTHVGGIVISNGIGWENQYGLPVDDMAWDQSEAGVAPEGKMSFDCVGQGGGIAASPTYWDDEYTDGAKTFSNSYGNANRAYDPTATAADTRMDASNDKMIIFAAGNDGPEPDTTSGMAKAKNGLAIGASQNFRPDQFEADNPNLVADFSSRGDPSQRFKPDLVAIGTAVVSGLGYGEWQFNAQPSGQGVPQPSYIMGVDQYKYTTPGTFGQDAIADYQYSQGTSMASPMAAGLYMLTREYFREVWGINNVNGQLAKALLINGAVRMDPNLYEYPGIDQGWGRIDLEQSLFPPPPRTNQFEEGLFTTTGRWTPSTINRNIQTPDVPLKVTLTWVDQPGASLIRNLDLIVKDPTGAVEYHGNQYGTSGVYKGWTDPNDPGYDVISNVEQVEVQYPAPGLWTVEVRGFAVPSTAKFALVFSADVGPKQEFQVNIETKYPTILSVAPGGSASLPFTVMNFGSGPDTIQISDDAPGAISTAYDWTNKPFASSQKKDNFVIFSANALTPAGVYDICINAVSVNDTGIPPASDSLCLEVEVLEKRLPYARKITTQAIDELDPSVLTFNLSGVNHIFIVYKKTTAINPADMLHGGSNVWVAHNTLDANHEPNGTWVHSEISNWNDYPNDLRMLYIDWGAFTGRVAVTWTGRDPNISDPNYQPYGRIAFSDPPYDAWQLRTIESNYGSNVYNSARVSFPIFRHVGPGSNGTLAWVWEHLDFTSTDDTQTRAVQTHIAFSWDGGNTWGPCLPASDPNNRCFLIAPKGSSNYYFFPNGMVDQNDVLWVFFYWRTPTSGQGRKLATALWDGPDWNLGWTTPINLWDAGSTTNIQFPAAVSTPEGGNRVYVAVTNDGGGLDKRLFTLYAQGSFGSGIVGPPPAAAPANGVSASFSTPQGPLGTAVSDANYNRRPVLNVVYTEDGIVWVPYMEIGNLYGVPNMWTWSSTDAFVVDRTKSVITADAFAKGHQMADTLTIGSKSCVYEVWHENIAPIGLVNYDVYLAIYCAGWETEPDNLGPQTIYQATIPNPYNLTFPTSFRLKADINDISTGYDNIVAAQMVPTALTVSDPALVDWTNAWTMNLTGVDRSPSEVAWLWANWTTASWNVGDCFRYWIRGQDNKTNWGAGDFVDVCVTRAVLKPPTPPKMISADLTGAGNADVTLTWSRSFDDGNGFDNVLNYKIWRATDIYGPYAIAATVPATNSLTYTWPDAGAGQGNFNNYFYYIQANSTDFDSPPTDLAAKFYRTMATGGKQLLGVPLVQSNGDPANVFKTMAFDSVRSYAGSCDPVDPWKSYKPGRAINDIARTSVKDGYWVGMTSGGTMTVAGLVALNVARDLCAGWNLVSFPSFNTTYTIAKMNADLAGLITAVEIFDPTAGPYYLQRLPVSAWATTYLEPGMAYWVKTSAGTTWAVPGH